MTALARLRSWLKWMVRRGRLEADLQAEMRFHQESYARDLVRDGLAEAEALRLARLEFGWIESHKDAVRASVGIRWSDDLSIDLRYAVRQLRASPGFTAAAVLVLAIGLGLNIATFSGFNVVALQPLPVRDPESLVRLQRRSPEIISGTVPYPFVAFYGEHARSLSAVIATMITRVAFEDDVRPVRLGFATPNYFSELGTVATYGRLLTVAQDDVPREAGAAVLSFDFWQRRLGADPSIVGRTIRLNHRTVTVAGILPPTFASLGAQYPDIWMSMTQQPSVVAGSHLLTDTGSGSVALWGRLAPGVTRSTAAQELLALTNELRSKYPHDVWEREFVTVDAAGHLQVVKPEMYQVMAIVGALTLLILAVACANLGGLLVARGVKRGHEITIRLALGASRQRLFRQLITESLLLAVLGTIAGIALGSAVLRVILVETEAPAWTSAVPDWRVLTFAVAMAFISAALFGLTPALHLARQKRNRTVARQMLVGVQVAASCVLLIVAGLLVRALQHTLRTSPGFGYERVLAIDPGLADHGYSPESARACLAQFESRVRALPGVIAVAEAKLAPLGRTVSRMSVQIDGHPVDIYPNWVSPDFFGTMEIPVLAGRTLSSGEKNAVVVSESLARRQWPAKNPLGQKFWDRDTVVGVVGNARMNALNDGDTVEAYWAAQTADMPALTLVVKTAGAPDRFPAAVKAIAEALDPRLVPEMRLLKASFDEQMHGYQEAVVITSLMGIAAVLLAALGLLGLVSHAVSERAKEIAIRMALGARPSHVLTAIVSQFLWPIAGGVSVGLAGTAALSGVLRKALFGVSNLDPLSYVGAITMLVAIAGCAAVLPARRALRLQPMRALHHD